MGFLSDEDEHKFNVCHRELKDKYDNRALNKMKICEELLCSGSKLDVMMKKGTCPRFKKLGDSKHSKVVFDLYDVAMYQACNKMMRDYES